MVVGFTRCWGGRGKGRVPIYKVLWVSLCKRFGLRFGSLDKPYSLGGVSSTEIADGVRKGSLI